MIISNCGGDAMIVKIDEIGKMMAKRMKEMSLNCEDCFRKNWHCSIHIERIF